MQRTHPLFGVEAMLPAPTPRTRPMRPAATEPAPPRVGVYTLVPDSDGSEGVRCAFMRLEAAVEEDGSRTITGVYHQCSGGASTELSHAGTPIQNAVQSCTSSAFIFDVPIPVAGFGGFVAEQKFWRFHCLSRDDGQLLAGRWTRSGASTERQETDTVFAMRFQYQESKSTVGDSASSSSSVKKSTLLDDGTEEGFYQLHDVHVNDPQHTSDSRSQYSIQLRFPPLFEHVCVADTPRGPTPVQEVVLPILAAGRHVMCISKQIDPNVCMLAAIDYVKRCRQEQKLARVFLITSDSSHSKQLADAMSAAGERVGEFLNYDEQGEAYQMVASDDRTEIFVTGLESFFPYHYEPPDAHLGLLLIVDGRALLKLGVNWGDDYKRMCHALPFTQKAIFFSCDDSAEQWSTLHGAMEEPVCVVLGKEQAEKAAKKSLARWSPILCEEIPLHWGEEPRPKSEPLEEQKEDAFLAENDVHIYDAQSPDPTGASASRRIPIQHVFPSDLSSLVTSSSTTTADPFPTPTQKIACPNLASGRDLLCISGKLDTSVCLILAVEHYCRRREESRRARILLVAMDSVHAYCIMHLRSAADSYVRNYLGSEDGLDITMDLHETMDDDICVVEKLEHLETAFYMRPDYFDLILVADSRVLYEKPTHLDMFEQLCAKMPEAQKAIFCDHETAEHWPKMYALLKKPLCITLGKTQALKAAEISTARWSPITCSTISSADASSSSSSASATAAGTASKPAVAPVLRPGVYVSFQLHSLHIHSIQPKAGSFVGVWTKPSEKKEEEEEEECLELKNCRYSPETNLLSMHALLPSGCIMHIFGRLVAPSPRGEEDLELAKGHLALAWWIGETQEEELDETKRLHTSTYHHVHNGVLMCANGLPLYRTSLDALQRHLIAHPFEMVQDGEYVGTLRLLHRDYVHSLLVRRARISIAKGGDRAQILSGDISVKDFGDATFSGEINLRTALLSIVVHVPETFARREIWRVPHVGYSGRMSAVKADSHMSFYLQQVPGPNESESSCPTFPCALNRVQLIPVARVEGCPIASQPVTTLALVCRFLDLHGLIACRQTDKRFAAAATHPLAFSHGIITATVPLSGFHVHGPQAVLSDSFGLATAIRSPLFANFRILSLRSCYKMLRPQYMYELFQTLVKERQTSLYSLDIESEAPAGFWIKELNADGETAASVSSSSAAASSSSSVTAAPAEAPAPIPAFGAIIEQHLPAKMLHEQSLQPLTKEEREEKPLSDQQLIHLINGPGAKRTFPSSPEALSSSSSSTSEEKLLDLAQELSPDALPPPSTTVKPVLRSMQIPEHRHVLRWLGRDPEHNVSSLHCNLRACKSAAHAKVDNGYGQRQLNGAAFFCSKCRFGVCWDCYIKAGGFEPPLSEHVPLPSHHSAWSLLFTSPATLHLKTLSVAIRLPGIPFVMQNLPTSLENLTIELAMAPLADTGLAHLSCVTAVHSAGRAQEKEWRQAMEMQEGGKGVLMKDMVKWIARASQLRKICFLSNWLTDDLRPPISPGLRYTELTDGYTTMRDIRVLAEIAALPRIEHIQWSVFIDPSMLQEEINALTQKALEQDYPPPELPSIPKVDTLALHVLRANESPFCLAMFPEVTRLVIAHYVGEGGIFTAWPTNLQWNLKELAILRAEPSNGVLRRAQGQVLAIQPAPGGGGGFAFNPAPAAAPAAAAAAAGAGAGAGGQDLVGNAQEAQLAWDHRRRDGVQANTNQIFGGSVQVQAQQGLNGTMVDSLAAAGLQAMHRMNLVGIPGEPVDLETLFKSMPELTDLTLKRISVKHPNLAFRHLKNLTALKELTWTWPEKQQGDSLALHFPSLVYLHVSEAAARQPVPWAASLASIPTLTAVRWRRERKVHPSQIVSFFKEMDAARVRIQRERAQADAEEAKAMVARAKLATETVTESKRATAADNLAADAGAKRRDGGAGGNGRANNLPIGSGYTMAVGGTAATPASVADTVAEAEAALQESATKDWQDFQEKQIASQMTAVKAGSAWLGTHRSTELLRERCALTGRIHILRQFCFLPAFASVPDYGCQLICQEDPSINSDEVHPSNAPTSEPPTPVHGRYYLYLFGAKMGLVELDHVGTALMKPIGTVWTGAQRHFEWIVETAMELKYSDHSDTLDQLFTPATPEVFEIPEEEQESVMLAMLLELQASFDPNPDARQAASGAVTSAKAASTPVKSSKPTQMLTETPSYFLHAPRNIDVHSAGAIPRSRGEDVAQAAAHEPPAGNASDEAPTGRAGAVRTPVPDNKLDDGMIDMPASPASNPFSFGPAASNPFNLSPATTSASSSSSFAPFSFGAPAAPPDVPSFDFGATPFQFRSPSAAPVPSAASAPPNPFGAGAVGGIPDEQEPSAGTVRARPSTKRGVRVRDDDSYVNH